MDFLINERIGFPINNLGNDNMGTISGMIRMTNNPLVSIVTVCLNSEKHLEQAIKSVLNQSYKNIEYLIIDGGSKHKTPDIIKKYEDRLS